MPTGSKEDASLFEHLDGIFIHCTGGLPCVSTTTIIMVLSIATLTRSRAHIVFEHVYISSWDHVCTGEYTTVSMTCMIHPLGRVVAIHCLEA